VNCTSATQWSRSDVSRHAHWRPGHQHPLSSTSTCRGAFVATLTGETLLVVCNVGAGTHALAGLLPEAVDAELVVGNLSLDDPGTLRPWEARVLRC